MTWHRALAGFLAYKQEAIGSWFPHESVRTANGRSRLGWVATRTIRRGRQCHTSPSNDARMTGSECAGFDMQVTRAFANHDRQVVDALRVQAAYVPHRDVHLRLRNEVVSLLRHRGQ